MFPIVVISRQITVFARTETNQLIENAMEVM